MITFSTLKLQAIFLLLFNFLRIKITSHISIIVQFLTPISTRLNETKYLLAVFFGVLNI